MRQKRPAFTLLEVLIVMLIIGILTSVLILNFQGVRERQELSLLADKSLALLQQAKAEVSRGKVMLDETGEAQYLCEGGLFEVGEVPRWVEAPSEAAGTCDFTQLSTEDYALSSGNAFVGSIEVGETSLDEILVFFVPPSGELQFYDIRGNTEYDGEMELRFETATFATEALSGRFVLRASEDTGFAQLLLDNESNNEE
ncbi:prepilin-type N-terminal cleavage/methylation domain-containing protein [Candidatus Peregrinibacteria bacterium]|nr:MAG: prepilin-type N-terminal cleavage/methylation domain-containing protein [Candidatus Peregrinibacteria bacterium]